jgi:hypothetical protein
MDQLLASSLVRLADTFGEIGFRMPSKAMDAAYVE